VGTHQADALRRLAVLRPGDGPARQASRGATAPLAWRTQSMLQPALRKVSSAQPSGVARERIAQPAPSRAGSANPAGWQGGRSGQPALSRVGSAHPVAGGSEWRPQPAIGGAGSAYPSPPRAGTINLSLGSDGSARKGERTGQPALSRVGSAHPAVVCRERMPQPVLSRAGSAHPAAVLGASTAQPRQAETAGQLALSRAGSAHPAVSRSVWMPQSVLSRAASANHAAVPSAGAALPAPAQTASSWVSAAPGGLPPPPSQAMPDLPAGGQHTAGGAEQQQADPSEVAAIAAENAARASNRLRMPPARNFPDAGARDKEMSRVADVLLRERLPACAIETILGGARSSRQMGGMV